MIARVAYFRFPSLRHRDEAERNGSERVGPALARAPGFLAIYYGRTAELEAMSISLFESRDANEAAGAVMNAQPLLPGQVAEILPTPLTVSFFDVLSSVVHDTMPALGRVGDLMLGRGADGPRADRWGVEVFTPMLADVPGLCQAYLLRSLDGGERIALTFWESADAMGDGGAAIGAWQAREAASGRQPAFAGTGSITLSDLRVNIAAVPATMPSRT